LLALVAAEAREFAGLLRHCEQVARLNWPLDFARTARLNGLQVVLAANGPGPKLAARAAEVIKEHQELEGLVSIGFCGALSPALSACDVFVADELHDVALALSVPRCECQPGKMLSIDRVATTAEEKRTLFEQTHAGAIEMEAAGLAAKAKQWNIPYYAVKVVTDTAAETFPLDFNRLRDREGRFSRAKIMAAALSRPSVFPALLNLNRRCKLAAQTLGDFLADARF
jgi:adenosylhomocysteine nucleosidase